MKTLSKILLVGVALTASHWLHAAATVEKGKTISVEIPVDTENVCNIEVVRGGEKTNVRVESNKKGVYQFAGRELGEETIRWEGKIKFRGLKSLGPCRGDGAIKVVTTESAEAKAAAEEKALAEAREAAEVEAAAEARAAEEAKAVAEAKAAKVARAEEEKAKNDLLNYVFSKKWEVAGLPCTLKGGAYQIFSNRLKVGWNMAAGGKLLKETGNKARFSLQALDGKTFRHVMSIYSGGNKLVTRAIGSSNARVSYTVDQYTLIDKSTLRKTRLDHRRMNFDLMMKGVYREDRGSEWGKVSTVKACR